MLHDFSQQCLKNLFMGGWMVEDNQPRLACRRMRNNTGQRTATQLRSDKSSRESHALADPEIPEK